MPKLNDITSSNNITGDDKLLFVNDPANTANVYTITYQNFLANVSVPVVVTNTLFISTKSTPANSSAMTINAGAMFYDSSYLYIATANNTLKRIGLSSF